MPTPQPYPHQLEPGTKGGVLGTGLRGMVWVFSRWKLCQVPAVLGGCEGHGLPTSMSVTLHFFPPSPLLRPEDLGGLLSCQVVGGPALTQGHWGWDPSRTRTYSELLRASAVQYASMGAVTTASNSASCSSSSSPGAKSRNHLLTPPQSCGLSSHPLPRSPDPQGLEVPQRRFETLRAHALCCLQRPGRPCPLSRCVGTTQRFPGLSSSWLREVRRPACQPPLPPSPQELASGPLLTLV